MTDHARARLLCAAVGFALVPPTEPGPRLLHRWPDCWRGVGDIAVGMHRQGWDLQLTEYGDGHWRATFFVTGMAHSIVGGTAWEPTQCRAVQRAAWEAINCNQLLGACWRNARRNDDFMPDGWLSFQGGQ